MSWTVSPRPGSVANSLPDLAPAVVTMDNASWGTHSQQEEQCDYIQTRVSLGTSGIYEKGFAPPRRIS